VTEASKSVLNKNFLYADSLSTETLRSQNGKLENSQSRLESSFVEQELVLGQYLEDNLSPDRIDRDYKFSSCDQSSSKKNISPPFPEKEQSTNFFSDKESENISLRPSLVHSFKRYNPEIVMVEYGQEEII